MDSLLEIWARIVRETEASQVLDGENRGLVYNIFIEGCYHRETAFAAKIFAAEHLRTGDEAFSSKAALALEALTDYIGAASLEKGLDEPMITPQGIKYRRGSIPATILLLESVVESAGLISYDFQFDFERMIKHLKTCYMGNGKFYHDAIPDKSKKHPYIVNTTAMIFFLFKMLHSRNSSLNISGFDIEEILKSIFSAMRRDGLFPYIGPQYIQKVVFYASPILPAIFLKAYNRLLLDNSIFFGDSLHHLVTLYYVLKGIHISGESIGLRESKKALKAWEFIKRQFRKDATNGISFDFSWEPKPSGYRHCNFIDTTTYFYIIDLLRYLSFLNLISAYEANKYRVGLSNHIRINLLHTGKNQPCINPYEGDEAVKEKIIPRPAETVFAKGALMADTIIDIFCNQPSGKRNRPVQAELS